MSTARPRDPGRAGPSGRETSRPENCAEPHRECRDHGCPPPGTWVEGIQAAAKHKKCVHKISALVEGASRDGRPAPADLEFYQPYLDVVWHAFGDQRVIYGSNWPVSDRGADYYTVQKLALDYAGEYGKQALKRFVRKMPVRSMVG
ncbi:MAG: amidohydrolase family protein [Planctomycetaceae bacterium]